MDEKSMEHETQPPIEIDLATPADAEGIANVHIKTWLATYPNQELGITKEMILRRVQGENGEKIPEKIEKWRKSIETQDNTHAVFVAKQGDQIIGFVGPRFDQENKRRIGAFYVLPEFQGKGVGSRLMEKALAWHGELEEVYLHVASYNQKAIDFYRHYHFKETGRPVVDQLGHRTGEVEIPEIEMVRQGSQHNSRSFFDSDEYQREIAAGYIERIASFPETEVAKVLEVLGLPAIDSRTITLATGGNIHATYLSPDFVIKLNQVHGEGSAYYANKFISDRLGGNAPVVDVVAYDKFEKTAYEALVMKRAPGKVLQSDIFEMSEAQLQELFRQILGTVNQMSTITFDSFGKVSDPHLTYPTYGLLLEQGFREHIATIRNKNLAREEDIQRIESYVLDRLGVFDEDTPVFVHTDLHMGNIMHDGTKLTSIIDFDHARKAPAMIELATLLSFIGYPQQFVEGRPEFGQYRQKNFLHLLPTLRAELPHLLEQPDLVKKLNLIYLTAQIHLISENWSTKGNAALIHDALVYEVADTDSALDKTFYGRTLKAG